MNDIKKFISEVSNYSFFGRIFFRKDVKEECEDLIKKLESDCDDLQLGITISDSDRQREQTYLEKALTEYDVVSN